MESSEIARSSRRNSLVRIDGAWLQHQLHLRLLTLSAFAAEVQCDESTLRKALKGERISLRKAGDIAQALRRLPVVEGDYLSALLGETTTHR